MTSLQDLIDAFRNGRLKLPALFDALGERGRVPDDQHARDVAWLEQQRDDGDLDPQVTRALLAKLTSLQPAATQDASDPEHAPSDDDDDITRVRPAPPAAPAQDDGDDSATVVRPASHPGTTDPARTGTTGGSMNTSTWQRVASESGGEYATVGMLLKSRFMLEKELGRGGMGVVYLARDERQVEARDRDPYVAVKVLNDEFRRHPDSLIALQREARRSQKLAHDNIVRVYDFDKDGTIVFMTMEYIAGTNLKTLLREQAYDGMPLARARPLVEGMAMALKRAHGAGVVHSDFKPGNVMVTPEGAPKVFDFGIARAGKFVGEMAGEETVFDAGTLGALTPAYASLEMLNGAEPSPADDIYALGCVTYELLTGKHPFDKVSAEVALKEGRKPPHVPGLTRRQNKALAAAVAFHGDQRLQNVQALVEGLREVGWRERSRPLVIYGVATLLVLAAAGWGVHRYLDVRHVDEVVGRFALDNPQHYANEDQAYQALSGLGADQGKRVVVDHSDVIERYMLDRLKTYWDPAHKRYDYAGVQHVFQVRDRLKLFSPRLDARRDTIEQQRNALLNTLDTQLSRRIAAGAIFRNQPNNVVDTLDAIRAIDPQSVLLDNTELKLKYDIAVGQSLDAGHIDQARRRLALAQRLFPESKRLRQRASQLDALEQADAAAARVAGVKLSVPEARKTLSQLLAKPSLAPGWRTTVAGALQALHEDHAPATQALRDKLAGAVAVQAATAKTPTQVERAMDLVVMGLAHAPKSQTLLAQQTRLEHLQKRQQAKLARESAAAEVASRIESMKRAVAAGDIDKARESLTRIRKLQPDNTFLAKQGPQLLATAYLGRATDLAGQGKYRQATHTVDKGLHALGRRTDLRKARARLDFVADLLQARGTSSTPAGIQDLRERLAALERSDAGGLAGLKKQLKRQGDLPGGSFTGLINALKTSTVATTVTPGAGEKPSADTGTKAVAKTPTPAPASAPVAALTARAPARAPATPTDPCARAGLAGTGRVCLDQVGDGRGPALVVIPGSGGKAFAMSRTEITVGEFNRFCQATGQCTAAGGQARLPVSDISLAQAKAYATWLSQATGHAYRLPTDAQWMRAAKAGQNWMQSPDSNCIPPSAGRGLGGPISARGRQPNPWGLVNMTGNVWEWVVNGGQTMIRGGSYNSYWSQCTVATHRSDSGKPQQDVGFRVVRELR